MKVGDRYAHIPCYFASAIGIQVCQLLMSELAIILACMTVCDIFYELKTYGKLWIYTYGYANRQCDKAFKRTS